MTNVMTSFSSWANGINLGVYLSVGDYVVLLLMMMMMMMVMMMMMMMTVNNCWSLFFKRNCRASLSLFFILRGFLRRIDLIQQQQFGKS